MSQKRSHPNVNEPTERIAGRRGKVSGTEVFREAKQVYTDAYKIYERDDKRREALNEANNNSEDLPSAKNSLDLLQLIGEMHMILSDINAGEFTSLGDVDIPYWSDAFSTPGPVGDFTLSQPMFETMMKNRSMYHFIKRIDALQKFIIDKKFTPVGGSRRQKKQTKRHTRRNRTTRRSRRA
jgi:hypothetical protein